MTGLTLGSCTTSHTCSELRPSSVTPQCLDEPGFLAGTDAENSPTEHHVHLTISSFGFLIMENQSFPHT